MARLAAGCAVKRLAQWDASDQSRASLLVLAEEWGVTTKSARQFLNRCGRETPDGRTEPRPTLPRGYEGHPHGRYGYTDHDCRCARCVEEYRAYNKSYQSSEGYRNYQREWGEANREKQREYSRRYREANPGLVLTKQRQYNADNAERRSQKNRERRSRNLERERVRSVEYSQRHRAERRASSRRRDAELREKIRGARTGQWSAAEDLVVARNDITIIEMCYMLDRSYSSVRNRRGGFTRRSN